MSCLNCGKEPPQHHNFCDWDCHVEHAKKHGGLVHTPNGLPVRCIMADGTMLECEGGDHPDYKFPLTVIHPDGTVETHALIYTDGSIALTIYEHCYTVWKVADGSFVSGPHWMQDGRLPPETLALLGTT